MPSRLSLLTSALLAAVVLLAEGKSIGSIAESGDLSGDESETNIENPVLTRAFTLQQEVAELKAQFNAKFPGVKDTNENYNTSDGCLPRNFSKAKCLKRITAALPQYRKQMEYIREEFQSTLYDGITYRIIQLQTDVEEMQKHKAGTGVGDMTHEEVARPTGSTWDRKAAVKGILRNFDQFLIDTHRALRYIHRKKLGEKRQLPHEKTPLN